MPNKETENLLKITCFVVGAAIGVVLYHLITFNA